MKKRLTILVLMLTLLNGPIMGMAQVPTNSTCPVMPGERAKEKFYVDYQGKRIYLCCRNCVIKFKKRPEKYLKKLNESNV